MIPHKYRRLWETAISNCMPTDNLEMGTFLEAYNLLRLNHEEIKKKIKALIAIREIESVIKSILK